MASNHHHLRSRQRGTDAPDLAAAAREAVVGFLRDSSMGPPAYVTAPPPGAMITPQAGATAVAEKVATDHADGGTPAPARVPPPASIAPGATAAAAELVAVRAAAASLATLDRIEAAAAKVEADIQAALRAQAELQAGAGAAADAAVRAAQDSWIAARTSEAAEGRVRGMLGLMTSYLAAVIALILLTAIYLVISSVIH